MTVQNSGIVPMNVAEIAQLNDPAFLVEGLPVSLNPGQSVKVTVRYRPPELGQHARTLQVITDSPSAPAAAVDLHGNAVRGLATLSGDSFDFGNVVINETATQDLSLTNNDGHALTSIAIDPPEGSDSGAFQLAKSGQMEMQPEQSMVVEINFKPTRLGDFQAAVQVTPCPTCSPRALSLKGRGVERLLVVNPPAIDDTFV